MTKIQKFIQQLIKLETVYIQKQLSRIDSLQFDLHPTPNGFLLIDSKGDRFSIDHDSFYNFLYNIERIDSIDHYDFFISRTCEDLEVQQLLEQFYFTELFRERFRAMKAESSDVYTSPFELLERPTPREARVIPTAFDCMNDKDKAYLLQDEWEEVGQR